MNPEQRQQKIESYGAAHAALVAALQRFPEGMWHYRPAPGRWTIHEIVIHLADSEANSYVRCRRFIAEPGQAAMPYDQDVWTSKLRYHEQSIDHYLELFKWLRKASYDLIKTLPEPAWQARLTHPEHNDYSFDRWLDIYERHIPGHVAQMQKNYEAWKARQAS